MEYKSCLQQVQGFLENSPLIILGSGASADYGLPLMSKLSAEIKRHGDKFDSTEFEELCRNLDSLGLEEALDSTNLSVVAKDNVRRIVWECINEKDLIFLQRLTQDKSDFALANLLNIIMRPTPNSATVVTTNYDRLAEYAADIVGATTVTGFEGNLLRQIEFPGITLQNRRIKARERIVNVWKVHGSLDWFLGDGDNITSFPLSKEIPVNHNPLIIPPGKIKYNHTHNAPYRDVITQADVAFSKAGSFLCIGYGFNDDHIQPKLIEQIKNGKPIVVLCQTATDACKQNVVSSDVKKFAVIEYSSYGKSSVTGNTYSEIYDGNFWRLPDFIKTFFGG